MLLMRNALAGIKKRKRDCLSLALLVCLTAMLINTALCLKLSIADFYYNSNERLNGAHYSLLISGNRYQNDYRQYIEQSPRVAQSQLLDTVFLNGATRQSDQGDFLFHGLFFSTGDQCSINPLSLVEGKAKLEKGEVYLPYFFKFNGYKMGDLLSFTYKGVSYSYQICGFFETTWNGTSISSMAAFYLSPDDFQTLFHQIGGSKYISVRLHELNQVKTFKDEFKTATGLQISTSNTSVTISDFDFFEMQQGISLMPDIMISIMLTFALIIAAIIFIVLRFRIYSHMEDNLKNTGVMKALGYTSRQIAMIQVLEYTLIAVLGCLLGIAFSYVLLQLLSGFISGLVGVRWIVPFNPFVNLLVSMGLLALIMLLSLFFTRKLKQISPAQALRGGRKSHNFKRNPLPLEKTKLPLPLCLSFKGMYAYLKQYLMIGAILTGVTAALSLSLLLYSNVRGKDSAVYKIMGMEMSNVMLHLAPHTDSEAISRELAAMPEVESISVFSTSSGTINGETIDLSVSDDFDKLKSIAVYEGSFPLYDNEIVITGTMAAALKKQIGDEITVAYEGVSANYLICGFTQTINNMGKMAILNLDGMKRIAPSYKIGSLQIHLRDGDKTGEFIEKLEGTYLFLSPSNQPDPAKMTPKERVRWHAETRIANLLSMYQVDSVEYALAVDGQVLFSGSSFAYAIDSAENVEELVGNSMGSVVLLVEILALAILFTTLLVIALILFLVIRYMVSKRRREFGILKAAGYTSGLLRGQIALEFMPLSAAGIGLGCISSGLLLNPVLSALLKPFGVSKLSFSSSPLLLLVLFSGLLAYVFLTAWLSARKVKKITPYELFTE